MKLKKRLVYSELFQCWPLVFNAPVRRGLDLYACFKVLILLLLLLFLPHPAVLETFSWGAFQKRKTFPAHFSLHARPVVRDQFNLPPGGGARLHHFSCITPFLFFSLTCLLFYLFPTLPSLMWSSLENTLLFVQSVLCLIINSLVSSNLEKLYDGSRGALFLDSYLLFSIYDFILCFCS